jgi:hypothetical protein
MPVEQSVADSRVVDADEDNVVMRYSEVCGCADWVRTSWDSGHSTQTGAHAAVVDDPPLGEEHPIHEARIA